MNIIIGNLAVQVASIDHQETTMTRAAIMAAFSIRVASKPADEDHPYGHGKSENVSGVVEALLVFAAAAIIVMAVRAVSFFVSRRLYKVARKEESVALVATPAIAGI
jgi:divalent metal cation (Fe/Co/Zn/Cd) transporter